MELKCFEVCDRKGQTGLVVWDRLILSVQLGHSYAFQLLSTRKEGDWTVLTTTPSSVVTAIAGIVQPSSHRLMTVKAEETLRGPVTGVQMVAMPRCSRCHTGQDNPALKLSVSAAPCSSIQPRM